MNLSSSLLKPKTLVLLDPTAPDGETALDLLEAGDTHVSLVVLMHGHNSAALHQFADIENIDLASAASEYLDQVAERIVAPGRVVEIIVSGGSDPFAELEDLVAHTETKRVLVPTSLQRQDRAAFSRFAAAATNRLAQVA
ncbi:MAG: hypothetical protein ACN4GZ_12410 [Acidimicrobiales bacterium]